MHAVHKIYEDKGPKANPSKDGHIIKTNNAFFMSFKHSTVPQNDQFAGHRNTNNPCIFLIFDDFCYQTHSLGEFLNNYQIRMIKIMLFEHH